MRVFLTGESLTNIVMEPGDKISVGGSDAGKYDDRDGTKPAEFPESLILWFDSKLPLEDGQKLRSLEIVIPEKCRAALIAMLKEPTHENSPFIV